MSMHHEAFDLQEALERAGYIDAGLPDPHVGRETSYPVADALRSRGIPFAFLTGHSREDLAPDFLP